MFCFFLVIALFQIHSLLFIGILTNGEECSYCWLTRKVLETEGQMLIGLIFHINSSSLVYFSFIFSFSCMENIFEHLFYFQENSYFLLRIWKTQSITQITLLHISPPPKKLVIKNLRLCKYIGCYTAKIAGRIPWLLRKTVLIPKYQIQIWFDKL